MLNLLIKSSYTTTRLNKNEKKMLADVKKIALAVEGTLLDAKISICEIFIRFKKKKPGYS